MGTRKLRHKIAPLLRVRDGHCGRDALFALLRQHRLLVPQKRSYTKPTNSPHRFHKHANLAQDMPKQAAPTQLWGSAIPYLPTRPGTVYLSLVPDAYYRRIVGHHVQGSQAAAGCLHHSDRVGPYVCDAY